MALWSSVCPSPASLCRRTVKCHWHERENKKLTCSNSLSVWSWRGGELSVSSLHRSVKEDKTHKMSQYSDNTITVGREPRFNAFTETYLSCDQQPWMKSFLPQRCPGKNKGHSQSSNKPRRFHHKLLQCKFQRRKILAFLTKQMAHKDNEKKPIRVSQ